MKYLVFGYGSNHFEVTDDATVDLGDIERVNSGEFHVTPHIHEDGEDPEVMVASSLEGAVAALDDWYQRHPPRWYVEEDAQRWIMKGYSKQTRFATLRVEDMGGMWLASRDNKPLLRNGKPATFEDRHQAKRAADLHLMDGLPGQTPIDDGLTWEDWQSIDWRSCPNQVEDREWFLAHNDIVLTWSREAA